MRARFRSMLAPVLLVVMGGCGGGESGDVTAPAEAPPPVAAAPEEQGPSVAVVGAADGGPFFSGLRLGAEAAAEAGGARIDWRAPPTAGDAAAQVELLGAAVADGVDGVVIAPADAAVLAAAVGRAAATVPVLVIGSAIDDRAGNELVSFIGTEPRATGWIGGHHLGELLDGEGTAVLLRHVEGDPLTGAREQGILKGLAAHPAVGVMVTDRYGGSTAEDAAAAALDLREQLKAADGIVCSSAIATAGMLRALRQEGLAGERRLVGFDATPELVEALVAGEIDALVVPDAWRIGYEAVDLLLGHLAGRAVRPTVSVEAVLVGRDDLEEAEIRRLVE